MESDLFSNLEDSQENNIQHVSKNTTQHNGEAGDPAHSWGIDPAYFPVEGFSPTELMMASGWGDGTLNFSMMPSQFNWMSQSLDTDFLNGDIFEQP